MSYILCVRSNYVVLLLFFLTCYNIKKIFMYRFIQHTLDCHPIPIWNVWNSKVQEQVIICILEICKKNCLSSSCTNGLLSLVKVIACLSTFHVRISTLWHLYTIVSFWHTASRPDLSMLDVSSITVIIKAYMHGCITQVIK